MTENLVLVPGAGQLPEVWTGVINQLPHGVVPKLPTLRGGLDEQVEQLQDYLQKHELTSFYLGGHAVGAMVAVRFAAAFPKRVRGLVLSDPQLRLDETQLKQTRSALKFLPKFLLRRRGLDKAELLHQLDDAAALDLSGDLAAVAEIPVQLLAARDTEAAAREVAAALPQAELEVVDAATGPGPAAAWFEARPEVFGAAVGRLLV
ncbi:alpha/beta fold hydrolase [Corynebacterium halotolerans]|uniref:alpha/beta fold hydrolase n=1 Tax=Corynebacterium halotolerans TaxID=225326 RepID=UPI003CF7C68B